MDQQQHQDGAINDQQQQQRDNGGINAGGNGGGADDNAAAAATMMMNGGSGSGNGGSGSSVGNAWDDSKDEYYDCDCPGPPPPPPPEFLLPPPPAPPSLAFCRDSGGSSNSFGGVGASVGDSIEYCDMKVVEGSYTQTALPSIAVIVLCSVLMLVMLLVATFLLWKHKKKMQNFLPCKTSPQNHCDLSGGNSVLYEDLTNIRPRINLANHVVMDPTLVAPVEVGVPSQLRLLDVKCSNYGGAGFTSMGNTMFIYPPNETDTLKTAKSREHFNPAYEEVSHGSEEKIGGESQDSDLESEEPPSVASEDRFAEDELSLADFPKGDGDGGPCSGTSSLRGSTGDDLCKDLDSLGSEAEHDPSGRHHHHHHHHQHHHPHAHHHHHPPHRSGREAPYPDEARVRTVERNRQHNYGGDNKVYDKDVLGMAPDYRPHPQEAELIEQLRQGATSGVALGPHEFVTANYPMGIYSTGGRPIYETVHHDEPYRDNYGVLPGGMIYTPGVYGAGELGAKMLGQAPPVYQAGRQGNSPIPPPLPDSLLGGARILNPARLPVPLISELSQKLNNGVMAQNGGFTSGGSNRNSHSSSGSGGEHAGRNSDPHERSLTEFSTFRPKKSRDMYAGDSGFVSNTTLPSSRRHHPQGALPDPPEVQKLLDDHHQQQHHQQHLPPDHVVRTTPTPRARRSKNNNADKKFISDLDPAANSRTVIT